MYNGWLHATLVTGVFCFAVDGTVIWGKHNVVGSWNDGEISRELQLKLMDPTKTLANHGLVADTAFPVAGELHGKIFTLLKEGELEEVPVNMRGVVQLRSRIITSLRQSCEWCMGAVEKVFRRLLNKLPFDKELRQRRLLCIYRLYNFRVRTTGISQVRSYFYS
jgi:hypothetical protein